MGRTTAETEIGCEDGTWVDSWPPGATVKISAVDATVGAKRLLYLLMKPETKIALSLQQVQ
jgi:hypothetical protein